MFKGLPLAKALQGRGHEVSVLTGFPNYPGGRLYPGYESQSFKSEVMDGVVVDRVPLFPSHDRSGVRRALNYLSFAGTSSLSSIFRKQRPDVVWVYNLVTLAPTWSIMRALHGCAVVLEVQDLWPESVVGSGMMRGAATLKKILAAGCAAAYRSADRLVAQSPGFKRHLMQLGVPSDRIDVIYNWTDEADASFSPRELSAVRERSGMSDRFTILFAGTMGTVQALDCVIDAAAQLSQSAPQVEFVLLGGGVDVERLKKRANGRTNVRFLPRCSSQEARELSCAADALLVHLKDDRLFSITIPSKTQSYLRAGRPILMGVRGDAASLVELAGAGFSFEPENAGSLVETVLRLLCCSPEDLRAMGSDGREFYDQKLSLEQGVSQLENTLAQAITAKQSASKF